MIHVYCLAVQAGFYSDVVGLSCRRTGFDPGRGKCDLQFFTCNTTIEAAEGGGGGGGVWRANAPLFGPQRGSHVDKQFCMYVETLPRSQTILCVRLDDFLGRAAALQLFLRPEPLWPPSEHNEIPHPRRPWGSSIK